MAGGEAGSMGDVCTEAHLLWRTLILVGLKIVIFWAVGALK